MENRVLAMTVVILLHAMVISAVWMARVELPHHDNATIEVALLSERTPVRPEQPLLALPARIIAPPTSALATDAPVVEIPVGDAEASPNPAAIAPPAANVLPASENLGTDLLVQCPERTPPRYPPLAKRQREQGEVRLRVVLDESGRIDQVTVISSSGSPRLDEAARAAVESWRCRPALHQGRPVRAIALQSLAFVLERH